MIELSKFLNKKISTAVGIGIVVVLGLIAGGVLVWHWGPIPKYEFPAIEFPSKPEKKVTITIDKTEYKQGEMVKITIKNGMSNRKWVYYPFWMIESFKKGSWMEVNRVLCPCGVSCRTPSYWELEPKGVISDEWDQKETWCKEGMPSASEATASEQVKSGRYRLKIETSDSKENAPRETIYSNEFRIKEKRGKIIEVSGRIYTIGNEPFTQLAIETDDGVVYGLVSSSKVAGLWEQKVVKATVRGYLLGRTPPSFRTEKSIDVMDFEVMK